MARARIGDCDVHYEVAGSGPPVLLLHGLGSCGRDWEAQVAALSPSYRAITVDLRGHGESSKPAEPYTMRLLSADVVHVLETLGVGSAHVVGFSLGGMVAFQLAVDAPSLVRTLVIVNSGPALVARTAREWFLLRSRFWALRLLGLRWVADRVATMNFPDPGQEAMRRGLAARLAANDAGAYLATLHAIDGWSVADRIGQIRAPTLVVSGDSDYTPVSAKEEYAARMLDARVVVIPRSRHVTPMDQTEAFNSVLLEFLRQHREPHAAALGSS
jgi:3-oxoadipate enol-lactonase